MSQWRVFFVASAVALVATGVVLGIVQLSQGGNTYISDATDFGVSDAGNMWVRGTIENQGDSEGSPTCVVKFYDSDGLYLSQREWDEEATVPAHGSSAFNVQTDLALGSDIPARADVHCE